MEETQFTLCFSVSRSQIPDYNPEETNLPEKILDHVGDFESLEQVLSKLTEDLNLDESQLASIRKALIKAEEEAEPPLAAANLQPPKAATSSKSKRKKTKKQTSKQQTQAQLLDPAHVETIEAMKEEISTTVDLLKIVQHLRQVLFPTRVGAGNKISGQVRAGNIMSRQVRAGNISEQAGLRKHVGHRWE